MVATKITHFNYNFYRSRVSNSLNVGIETLSVCFTVTLQRYLPFRLLFSIRVSAPGRCKQPKRSLCNNLCRKTCGQLDKFSFYLVLTITIHFNKLFFRHWKKLLYGIEGENACTTQVRLCIRYGRWNLVLVRVGPRKSLGA